MALGDITIVEAAASQGPIFYDRVTIVGDGTYPTGGTAGFEASFQAAVGSARQIIAVMPEEDSGANKVSYDHANDKLLVRAKANNAEASAGNLSAQTFRALIVSQ